MKGGLLNYSLHHDILVPSHSPRLGNNIVCLPTMRYVCCLIRVRLFGQIFVSIRTNANNYMTTHWTCQNILKNGFDVLGWVPGVTSVLIHRHVQGWVCHLIGFALPPTKKSCCQHGAISWRTCCQGSIILLGKVQCDLHTWGILPRVPWWKYHPFFWAGKRGECIHGRFGYFCWLDSLALAVHVPLLSFLGFREVLCNIFFIDEWPGKIFSFADSFEPGGFCWEACHTVMVPNSWFNAGELVYVV